MARTVNDCRFFYTVYRYWLFDLVLHWLSIGEMDEVDGVVHYLIEHEKVGKMRKVE